MTRARDLSRLANDSALTATDSGFVGVGTTQPKTELNVVGVVSATSFYGDGTNLSNTGSTLSAASGTERVVLTSLTSGTMTASSTDANVTYNATTQTLSVPNVSIAGTLTYEDVTNVDSVGLITARNGAIINAGTATTALIVNGDARVTGILTVGTSSITLDGSENQVNVGAGVTIYGNTGIVSATKFYGDGSELSGVGLSIGAGSTASPSLAPSGDSNTGIFFPAADTIAFAEGGVEAARIDSSGRLLVGTDTSRSSNLPLQIASDSTGAIEMFRGSASADSATSLILSRSRGSTTSPSAVSSGDALGYNFYSGYDGSNYISAASIKVEVDGTPGANDMPGRLVFSTTVDGQSTPGEAMRITSLDSPADSSFDRAIWMSNGNTPDSNETAWKLYVRGSTRYYNPYNYSPSSTRKGQFEFWSESGSSDSNSNAWNDQKSALYVRGWLENGNPGEAASVLLLNGDWSGATNPGRLIKGYQKATTLVFVVNNNGNVTNLNNSYGSLSDEKLKQDIVDAESQWNDIKNLRVRKFKFKKDVEELGDEAPSLLGLIAQEAELVSPGLIETPGSYDEEGTEDQNLSKTVKYSILYMKAVKALQEAQERIETLETVVSTLTDRVSALESN